MHKKIDYLNITFFLFFTVIIWLFLKPSVPSDDLLRHAISYKYNYDYRNIFGSDYFPYSWNMWLLFDIIVGYIHRVSGGGYLFIAIVQTIGVILLYLVIEKNLKDKIKDISSVELVLGFAFILSAIWIRVWSGRPVLFVTIGYLYAVGSKNYRGVLVMLIVGCMYWLSFLYIIPLLIVSPIFVISLIGSFCYWLFITNGSYFSDIVRFYQSINASGYFQIEENLTILGALYSNVSFALLFVLTAWKAYKTITVHKQFSNTWIQTFRNFIADKESRQYLIPVAFFLLLNQSRYIDILYPLMFLYISEYLYNFIRNTFTAKSPQLKELILIYISITLALGAVFSYYGRNTFLFKKEITQKLENKNILAEQKYMFPIVYSVEKIKQITPSMDFRMGIPDKRDAYIAFLIEGMNKNSIDCHYLLTNNFDYVVESIFSVSNVPACVKLDAVERNVRIWKVIKPGTDKINTDKIKEDT